MKQIFRLKKFLMVLWLSISLSGICLAEMGSMEDSELKDETGMGGFVDFNVDAQKNSVRMFMDVHVEQYTEIDSLKMGYYERSDFETLKYHNLGTPVSTEVNSNYLAVKQPDGSVLTGVQGSGANTNTRDWDLNWENVRLGKSEAEPLVWDGLIVRLDYDDVDSPNRKLQQIAIGTNCQTGEVSANMNRTSGVFNPDLVSDSRLSSNPILMKRDSFMTNWNTANFNQDGFFLVMGLEGPNKGFQILSGYNEDYLNAKNYNTTEWWDK